MKMIFVIHSLNQVGGAETVLVNFANYFSSQLKYDVSIVLLSNAKISFQVEKKIKFYKLSPKTFKNSSIAKLKLIEYQINHIRSVIRGNRPDILISFMSAVNVLASFAGWLEKVPVILSEHTSYNKTITAGRSKANGLVWKILRRVSYPLASKVFILTEEDKEYYSYLKEVEVIPNPLILSNHHGDLKREDIILGVGRLHPVKGFDMLIEAFSLISNQKWKLFIAGEGDEHNYLKGVAKKFKIEDRVTFLGFVEDMEYCYKKASIYVLSSLREGFPGGLCEAMGYGCASIAFNCPTGPKEIIDNNQNGILVEAKNINLLSQQIQILIDKEEQRLQLSKEGKKITAWLDIESISKRWITLINESIYHYQEDKK
jgi:glycosyltransferase involved in cell wall biosynthesis